MGDTVMALFGAPLPMEPKEQVAMSVRCAVNIHRALLELDEPGGGDAHRD
jgi:class 3 adenylate cyclase